MCSQCYEPRDMGRFIRVEPVPPSCLSPLEIFCILVSVGKHRGLGARSTFYLSDVVKEVQAVTSWSVRELRAHCICCCKAFC